MRPCQRPGFIDQAGGSYPHPQVCGTPNELVLVAESDDLQREYLLGVVRDLGYRAVGVATASELYERATEAITGCILLDMMLPGVDALALQQRLNRLDCNLPVVFISSISDAATIVQCMKLGAVDFLQKPIGEMALRRATIAAIAESQQRNCIHESRDVVKGLVETLTPTELIVARMIGKGFPTKLIAAELGRSENTVKIHRHRIFNKLMVNSAASIANIMRHVGDEHPGE